jgi:hypothetical protein
MPRGPDVRPTARFCFRIVALLRGRPGPNLGGGVGVVTLTRGGDVARQRTDVREDQLPEPPAAPRRIRFRRTQLVGLLLVAVVPVLSAAGVLDRQPGITSGSDARLAVSVSYPQRMRYRTSEWLTVDVHNRSEQPIDGVTVQFDQNYVRTFNPVLVVPSPRDAFNVELGRLDPGTTRQVALQLQAEEYGPHPGWVRVRPGQQPPLELPVRTRVLW